MKLFISAISKLVIGLVANGYPTLRSCRNTRFSRSMEAADAALHPDDHNGNCAPDLGT